MPRRPCVLFVESPLFESDAPAFLERSGLQVARVPSLEGARDEIRDGDVDCVVTNMEVTGRNGTRHVGGLDVLDAINDEYPELPCIVYTEVENRDVADEVAARDAFGFVAARETGDARQRLLETVESAIAYLPASRRATREREINAVVRSVNQSLVTAQTRERIVADLSAVVSDAARYTHACVVTVERGAVTVESVGQSGRPASSADINVEAPIRTAASERTLEVEYFDTEGNGDGIESESTAVMAVPLDYHGSEYGVLVMYTDRPNAFQTEERETFRELGHNVALAAHATETREALRERTERLERFARIISHELRNPLQTAMARLDVLEETGDPKQYEIIKRNHSRMSRLVEDLVELVRHGERSYDVEAVSVEASARRAWKGIIPPDATLAVESDATIEADSDRLTQLFENCFVAALDHTDGALSITITTGDDGFSVIVNATGFGTEDTEQPFELRYATDDIGEGLAMHLVERIAARHGWTIGMTETDQQTRLDFQGVTFR